MAMAEINGVRIHYEITGEGEPLVWSHEFAGDHRSWDPQVDHFARRYRNITYDNRGYPPSEVPSDPAAYSQDQLVEDLRGLLDHLGVARAHLAGLSMGANVVLNFALRYPARCRGIVVAGCGSGSSDRDAWVRDAGSWLPLLRSQGIEAAAEVYGHRPTRLPLQRKSPRAFARFLAQLREHSALGSALTYEGVQLRRPSIFELGERLRELRVPVLLVVGDEDTPVLECNAFMKRQIPGAGLLMLPNTGHAVNLEEPGAFNAAAADFFALVEQGRWPLGA